MNRRTFMKTFLKAAAAAGIVGLSIHGVGKLSRTDLVKRFYDRAKSLKKQFPKLSEKEIENLEYKEDMATAIIASVGAFGGGFLTQRMDIPKRKTNASKQDDHTQDNTFEITS